MKKEIQMESLPIEERKAILERQIQKPKFEITGLDSLYEDIRIYLNDSVIQTIDGLELQKTRCKQAISICDEITNNPEFESFIGQNNEPEKYKSLFKPLLKRIKATIKYRQNKEQPIEENTLKTDFKEPQLSKIFDNLVSKKVTASKDKTTFLSFFTIQTKGLVYWNSKVFGAKAGLFDLMERITGNEEITESELKLYFKTDEPIHRNWKDKNGKKTGLINKIMQDI